MRLAILLAAIVLAAAALWLFVEQPEYDSPAVDVSKVSSDAVAADEWVDGNADPADGRLVQPVSAEPKPETNSAAQLDFSTGPDVNPLTHPGAYVMSMVDSARAGDTSAQRTVVRAAKYCESVQQWMQMAEAPVDTTPLADQQHWLDTMDSLEAKCGVFWESGWLEDAAFMAEINAWNRAHQSPIPQELLKIRISVSAEDDYLEDILAELNLNSEQELYPRANALMLEALESGDGFTIERAWQTYAGMIKVGAVGVRYPEEWAYSPASLDRVGLVVGPMAACEVFSGCQVQSVLPEMMCMRAWTLCVPPDTSSFAFMMQRLVPPSDQPLMRDVYNWYLEIFQSGAFDRLGLYVNPEFQGGG